MNLQQCKGSGVKQGQKTRVVNWFRSCSWPYLQDKYSLTIEQHKTLELRALSKTGIVTDNTLRETKTRKYVTAKKGTKKKSCLFHLGLKVKKQSQEFLRTDFIPIHLYFEYTVLILSQKLQRKKLMKSDQYLQFQFWHVKDLEVITKQTPTALLRSVGERRSQNKLLPWELEKRVNMKNSQLRSVY